jgi:hypothetical protein
MYQRLLELLILPNRHHNGLPLELVSATLKILGSQLRPPVQGSLGFLAARSELLLTALRFVSQFDNKNSASRFRGYRLSSVLR